MITERPIEPGEQDSAKEAGQRTSVFDRVDLILAAVLFIVGLAVYFRTMAHGMLLDDSSECQLVAAGGGLMHATGYAVYIIIAKLFTFIPFGSLAWRVNFLSVFMGGTTLAGIYFLARALEVRRLFCILGAFVLLLSQLFWSQATIAEVYTTSNTFLLGFLICAVAWGKTRSPKWLLMGGLLGGLCLGLHFMNLLTLPAIVVYLIWKKARKADWASAAVGAVAGASIAMAFFVILATPDSKTSHINSIRPSVGQYGMQPSDLNSPFAQIAFVMTAREFRSTIMVDRFGRLKDNGGTYWQKTVSEVGWAGLVLAAIGLIGMLATKRRRKEGVLLFLAWSAMLFFVLTYSVVDLEVEFIPTFVLDCVFLAVGLQILQEALLGRLAEKRGVAIAVAATAAACLIVSGWSNVSGDAQALADGAPTFLKGDDRTDPFPIDTPDMPHDYAAEVMSHVPNGALVVAETQVVDDLYYVAIFEENKKNVDIVERTSYSDHPQMADSLLQFIRASCNKRPVYTTGMYPKLVPDYHFENVPCDFPLFRITPLH